MVIDLSAKANRNTKNLTNTVLYNLPNIPVRVSGGDLQTVSKQTLGLIEIVLIHHDTRCQWRGLKRDIMEIASCLGYQHLKQREPVSHRAVHARAVQGLVGMFYLGRIYCRLLHVTVPTHNTQHTHAHTLTSLSRCFHSLLTHSPTMPVYTGCTNPPLPTHTLTALSRCWRASTTLLVWWYSTRPSWSLTRASIRVEGHRVRVARRQRTDSETRGGVWWRWCSEMASRCEMVGLWRVWKQYGWCRENQWRINYGGCIEGTCVVITNFPHCMWERHAQSRNVSVKKALIIIVTYLHTDKFIHVPRWEVRVSYRLYINIGLELDLLIIEIWFCHYSLKRNSTPLCWTRQNQSMLEHVATRTINVCLC